MSLIVSTQEDLILRKLLSFYKDEAKMDRILPIINGKSRVSLRLVDWFTTNYSKKYFTSYLIETAAGTELFKVYNSYKLILDSYTKRRMDPFCRWERISVPYKDGPNIETTIGQLNFFKWMLENGVLDYIEAHLAEIARDMDERNSTSRRNRLTDGPATSATKTRKKREELSISASKSVKREDVEITVSFR